MLLWDEAKHEFPMGRPAYFMRAKRQEMVSPLPSNEPQSPLAHFKRIFGIWWGSLSLKLSLPVGLVIFLAVGLAAYLNVQHQRQQMFALVREQGMGFTETLHRTVFRTMMAEQRGHLYHALEDVAEQPGIRRVRIMNAEGLMTYSTQAGEAGKMVDKNAEACYGCHAQDKPLERLPKGERTRLFSTPSGEPMLGTIQPIYNQARCSGPACHVHPKDKKVLGVLDVDLSLAQVEDQLREGLRTTLVFAFVLFIGVSTIIGIALILTVNRTVSSLSTQVDKVASGDVYYVSRVQAPAELGRLADSINYMAQRVARRTETMDRRYRSLVLHSPEAVMVLDGQGRVILANPELSRILGVELEQLQGQPLADLLDENHRPDFLRALQDTKSPGGACALLRLRVKRPDGSLRDLQGRLTALEEEVHGFTGVLGTFSDVSDRSHLEGQLVRHARLAAVGQTVSGLVPYIRNLLHGLGNAGYIVDQGLAENDPGLIKQGWDMVTKSAARISQVSQDLLFFADYRIERRQPCDLNHLLGEIKGELRDQAEKAGVEILLHQSLGCTAVPVDRPAVRRALLNLAHNALEALNESSGSRRVVLGCDRKEDGEVVLWVEDNGPGITPAQQRSLFAGLFSTKGAEGTGMGLLLTQKIAEAHGGYIDFNSQPGAGARFTMILPDSGGEEATEGKE